MNCYPSQTHKFMSRTGEFPVSKQRRNCCGHIGTQKYQSLLLGARDGTYRTPSWFHVLVSMISFCLLTAQTAATLSVFVPPVTSPLHCSEPRTLWVREQWKSGNHKYGTELWRRLITENVILLLIFYLILWMMTLILHL
jgi:hypothetical protein